MLEKTNIFLSNKQKQRLERIYLIAKLDFNKRYYGSKLGVLWAFLNPMFYIIIYYFAFSYLIIRNRDSDYVLYIFSGIITWQFFAQTTAQGLNIFRKQKFILENIPIPKIDFFWAHILSNFQSYFLNFIIYFLFSSIFFSLSINQYMIYLIPIFIGLICFSLGVTFFISTLFLFFRDLNHFWSIVLLAGFWTIPIIWDYKILFNEYPFMLYNPLTAFLINIRQITLNRESFDVGIMIMGLIISFMIFILGYVFMLFKSKKAVEIL